MKEIICFFLQHEYVVTREINYATRELICKRCGGKFGINDQTKVVLPLDDELIEAHEVMLRGDN
jgi:uncharacterized protein YbaR (Trm112 family)